MTKTPFKTLTGAAAIALVISVSACSGMNNTQQRTLSGAGIGAAGGAAVGAMTGGSVAGGAAVGAAAGAAGGYLYDQSKK